MTRPPRDQALPTAERGGDVGPKSSGEVLPELQSQPDDPLKLSSGVRQLFPQRAEIVTGPNQQKEGEGTGAWDDMQIGISGPRLRCAVLNGRADGRISVAATKG